MKSNHLTPGQRNLIRYHLRMSEEGIARKFGISVADVRAVRASAQPDHPARLAAMQRREGRLQPVAEFFAQDIPALDVDKIISGRIDRREIPATSAEPPLGQLHVEGGADLPAVLE